MKTEHQASLTNQEKSVLNRVTFYGLRLEFDNEPDQISSWWKSIACVFPELRSHNILVLLNAINSNKDAFMEIMDQQYHSTFIDSNVDALQKLWIIPQSLQAELQNGKYEIVINQTIHTVTITILKKDLSNGHKILDILNNDRFEYDICSIGYTTDEKEAERLLGVRYPGAKFNYEFY